MDLGHVIAIVSAAIPLLIAVLGAWVSVNNKLQRIIQKLEDQDVNIDRFYSDRFNPMEDKVDLMGERIASLEARTELSKNGLH